MNSGDKVVLGKGCKGIGLRKGQVLKVLKLVGIDQGGTTILFEMVPQGRIRQLYNRRTPPTVANATSLWLHNGDPTLRVLAHVI